MRFHLRYIYSIIFCFSGVYAQELEIDSANLSKYWHYRERLTGRAGAGFVHIGLGAGQSLLASGRAPDAHCGSYFFLKGAECPTHEGMGLMIWSDGSYYLGYYIAALALEVGNLRRAGQESRESEWELFCALKAVERLDLAAEPALGLGAGAANGFFIRDDVGEDFYYAAEERPERKFKISKRHGYECIYSDYACHKRENVRRGGYASQDQIIALLLGLATVAAVLPDGGYVHEHRNYSFREMAELYADRMVHYLVACRWRLRSPDGQRIPERWGGDVRAFSYGLAKAAERICGGRFRGSYQTRISRGLGRLLDSTFQWGWRVQNPRNHSMIYALAILGRRWSGGRMSERSHRSDQPIYALWDCALNSKPLQKADSQDFWRQFLATAPADGPCHNSPDCQAPKGWRSSDRWWQAQNKNGNPYGLHFEFNGLDYILAYNLYHYLYAAELPTYAKRGD